MIDCLFVSLNLRFSSTPISLLPVFSIVRRTLSPRLRWISKLFRRIIVIRILAFIRYFGLYLSCFYALNNNTRWKKLFDLFIYNLDSREIKTRTVEMSEPYYRLVLQDLILSCEWSAFTFDDVCVMVQTR